MKYLLLIALIITIIGFIFESISYFKEFIEIIERNKRDGRKNWRIFIWKIS